MVNVVIHAQPGEVDGFAAVHAFAHLRVVQVELCIAQRRLVAGLQLLPELRDFGLARGVELLQPALAGGGARLVFFIAAGDLHKDPAGRAAHQALDLRNDGHRLVNGPADARRGVAVPKHLVQRARPRAEFLRPVALHGLGKAVLSREQLHQVAVRLPDRLDEIRHFAGVRVGVLDLRQEFPGEISPAAEAAPVAQNVAAILGGERVRIVRFQPALQQPPVLAVEHDVANDVLQHRLVRAPGDQGAEDLRRREVQPEGLVHARQRVAFAHQSIGEQIALQRAQIAAPLGENVLVEDALLRLHGDGPPVDLQLVDGVQRHEFAVQQRIPGQNRLADVAAHRRHALDEFLRAGLPIDHPIKIPGRDLLRRAHHPAVFGFGIQRADGIGDAEAEHREYLLPSAQAARIPLVQEGQMARGPLQNPLQLLRMQLVGEHAVVPARLPGQEAPQLQAAQDPLRLRLTRRVQLRQQRLDLFARVGAEFVVVAAVVRRAVAAVRRVVVQLVVRRAEHGVEGPLVRPEQRLQPRQIFRVLLVDPDLRAGDVLFAHAQLFEQRPVVEPLDCANQLHVLAQRAAERRLHRLKVVPQGEGSVVLLRKLPPAQRGRPHLRAREQIQRRAELRIRLGNLRAAPQLRLLPGHAQLPVQKRPPEALRVREREFKAADVHEAGFQRFQAAFEADLLQVHVAEEEVPALFENVVHGQIDQPHVEGPILLHQRAAQMVDRGEVPMIVPVAVAGIGKERVAAQGPPGGVRAPVLLEKFALVHPLKEGGIHLRNLRAEELSQPAEALVAPLQPPPGRSEPAPVLRLLRFRKQPHAPERLAVALLKIVLRVRHRPTHGIRANIQADQIIKQSAPSPLTFSAA